MSEDSKWTHLNKQRQLELLRQDFISIQNLEPEEFKENPEALRFFRRIQSFEQSTDQDLVRLFLLHNKYLKTNLAEHLWEIGSRLERLCNAKILETDFLVSQKDGLNLQKTSHPIAIVAENLRSSFNVGSLFRAADCLGASHIEVVGYTATPEDPRIEKSALGASDHVKWSHSENINEAISKWRSQGAYLVGLETAKNSTDIYDFKWPKDQKFLALFIGNERFGLTPDCLSQMDEIVSLPTFGVKNSLNVIQALTAAGYQLIKSYRESL